VACQLPAAAPAAIQPPVTGLDARDAAEAMPGARARTPRTVYTCKQMCPAWCSAELSWLQSRLRKELQALVKDPIPNITALPLDDNILEWHCPLPGGGGGGRLVSCRPSS
jgi:hypothetical protein